MLVQMHNGKVLCSNHPQSAAEKCAAAHTSHTHTRTCKRMQHCGQDILGIFSWQLSSSIIFGFRQRKQQRPVGKAVRLATYVALNEVGNVALHTATPPSGASNILEARVGLKIQNYLTLSTDFCMPCVSTFDAALPKLRIHPHAAY